MLGYLDDLILLPLAILLVVRLVPADLMAEFRAKADGAKKPSTSRAGMIAILVLSLGAMFIRALWPMIAD